MSNIIIKESIDNIDDEKEIRIIKSNQSIAESNIMTLPFISMSKTKVKVLKRVWISSNGAERGITVKGSADLGVPTIEELDLLLALFRIQMKNLGFKYEYNTKTKKVYIPQKINFTYTELAYEMGYKTMGGILKTKLEKSLKKLLETTIYSELNGALRDVEKGEYVTEFNGIESFRILTDYKYYSYKKIKAKGENIGNAETVKENTSVMIDTFFYNQICSNYFKIYDYKGYTKLTKGVAKKLFLLLNQWSHGNEKVITYNVLYDMLALDNDKPNSYNNREIKKALEELIEIKFIEKYDIVRSESVRFIFNSKETRKDYYLNKYTTEEEVIGRMHELGMTYDEITRFLRLDNKEYVKALLRYIDKKIIKKTVSNPLAMLKDGLKYEDYDVSAYYG